MLHQRPQNVGDFQGYQMFVEILALQVISSSHKKQPWGIFPSVFPLPCSIPPEKWIHSCHNGRTSTSNRQHSLKTFCATTTMYYNTTLHALCPNIRKNAILGSFTICCLKSNVFETWGIMEKFNKKPFLPVNFIVPQDKSAGTGN